MPRNVADFNVDSVRVVKILGGALNHSRVVRGMVFGREPDGVVKKGSKLKVAVYTCGLDISQTETKGTVLLKNASEMLDFTKGEEKQMENVSLPPLLTRSSFACADNPGGRFSPVSPTDLQGDRRLWRRAHHRRIGYRRPRPPLPQPPRHRRPQGPLQV